MKENKNQRQSYEQRLDLYYIGTIAYLVTLIAYALVAGTISDAGFEVVLKDPIIYLLALVSLVSIVALVIAAVLRKRIEIDGNDLVFSTRFKERRISPDEIEWLRFTAGARGKIRQGSPERAVRMKLKNRRRKLWIRPAGFALGDELVADLRAWVEGNSLTID